MKKLLILAMTIVLALGMMGSAFAYFTDTATSTGNTFTAGTLDLDVVVSATSSDPGKVTVYENADGLNDSVVFNNLAPGDSGQIVWVLTNTGSIPGTLDVKARRAGDSDGVDIDQELLVDPTPGGLGELDDNMWLTTRYWMDAGLVYQWGPGYISGASTSWYSVDSLPMTMPAGSVYTIQWDWSIDGTVGNVIQGDTFQMDLEMFLNQIP